MENKEKRTKRTLSKDLKVTIRQHCPVCNRYVKVSVKYPNYACVKCQDLAVDSNGEKVEFLNAEDQCCKVIISKTKEILASNTCFINGLRFKVEQANDCIVLLPSSKRQRKSSTKEVV